MEAPALAVTDLTVEDDQGRRLLDGFELQLAAHEAVGLVGRSGVGKSTLVSLLTGRLPAGLRCPRGEIRAFGVPLYSAATPVNPPAAVPLGILWQDAASTFDPLRSIAAHVEEVRAVARQLGREAPPTLELLDRVGLGSALGPAYPHQLSGGMLQRAQLAVVLASVPELIVADEPTTALDPPSEREVLSALRSARRAKADGGERAMLFISHDLALVKRMVTRVVTLRGAGSEGPGVRTGV